MRKVFLTAVTLTILLLSHQNYAQNKFSLEFRPGINFSTNDISNTELDTGFGFEQTIAYRFMSHLAFYAGWSWNHFSTDQSFVGADASFEETGYTFGLQFIHPVGKSNINYLIRAGATYNHIEVENSGGEIIIDSDHDLGWQAEAGLVIPLSKKFSLLPSIRYRSLSNENNSENININAELKYVSVGVGLAWTL